MRREELFDAAFEANDLPPIYIRSHDRADKLDTLRRFPFLEYRANLIVAADEFVDYAMLWEEVHITTIPESYPGEKSSGRAISFILDLATARGQEDILILDDDLMSISCLYEEGDKVSRAVNRWQPDREVRNDLNRGFFALAAMAFWDACESEPTVALGGIQVQSPSWVLENALTMWRLNSGPVFPSQFMFVHVPRFREYVGQVDPDFWEHGDDLSMTADLLAAGGSTVLMPSFISGWRSYETESVIRNGETAPAYRQREHELIMTKPLGDAGYITTKYDVLDRPWWHRINWAKLRRHGWVKIAEKSWNEGIAFPEDLI